MVFKLNYDCDKKMKKIIDNNNLNHFEYIGKSRLDGLMMYKKIQNNRLFKLNYIVFGKLPEKTKDDLLIFEALNKGLCLNIITMNEFLHGYF